MDTVQNAKAPAAPVEGPPTESQATHDASIDVAEYLHGQGLNLAHVGYSDADKGIEVLATDQDGKLQRVTENLVKKHMVEAGYLHPDSQVKFTPNSYNAPESALNELPIGLDRHDHDKIAWEGGGKETADMLVKKYGPDRVSVGENGTAVSVQDIDGVWRKISPDFHDDTGSWNWGNFVTSMQHHQKDFASMLAFTGAAAVATPAIAGAFAGTGVPAAAAGAIATAGASVAGGVASDVANLAMGRVVGTTGETPDQALRTMALHSVVNAALPMATEVVTEHAVIPLLKGAMNALSYMGSGVVSQTARLMSMFGDSNATGIEHAMTSPNEVSGYMDKIVSTAKGSMKEAATNGRALNKYDAVQQASASIVNEAGSAFAGTVEDAGKLNRNLNNWMNNKTQALVASLPNETRQAMQQEMPVKALQAGNEFRNFLGTAGVPVNAAGRVTANDLASSFGTMTPEEASLAAKSVNMGMATLEKLGQFDITDPSAFKDLANMHASIENMKGLLSSSAMAPDAIKQAMIHLDNVGTVAMTALPMEFRPQYAALMKQYANAAHATNYVLGSALKAGSSETMASAGDRVASLMLGKQGGNKSQAALFDALMDITPNAQKLQTELQHAVSARGMLTYSSAPTSTIGGALERGITLPIRVTAKGSVMALGKAASAAGSVEDSEVFKAANVATQKAFSTPAGKAIATFLKNNNPLDPSNRDTLIRLYGNYKASQMGQNQ